MKFKNIPLRFKLALGTGTPMLLLVFLAFIAITSSRSQVQTNAMVDHTHKVIQQAKQIEAAAVDMETGMRGFLLAGKEDFLEPYIQGQQRFSVLVSELKTTVSDNPTQVKRLGEIEQTINDWLTNVTEPVIQLRREIGHAKTMDDVSDLIAEARGKVFFDKFRSQITLFTEREEKLLAERQAVNRSKFDDSVLTLVTLNEQGYLDKPDSEALMNSFSELSSATDWVNHTYKVMASAQDVLAAAVDMETGMRGYLLAGREEFLEPYRQGSSRFKQLVSELKQTVGDNPQQVALLEEMNTTISSWQADVVDPMITLRREIGDAKTMNDMAKLVGEARGKVYFDKFRGQISEFVAMEDELMVERQAAAVGAAKTAETTIMLGTLLAIALGVGISWVVLRAITEPVKQVAIGLESLAKGDLTNTLDIDSKDELGAMAASYNQAVEKTNRAILEVLQTTDEVVDGSMAISQANTHMSQELGVQSEKIAQISSSIEQMSHSIQEVAAKSSEATANAQEAGVTANSGGKVVQNTIEGMNSINEAVTASSNSVSELGKRGAEIGEIINVIKEIAEQTNLLALNAAIEAARAGEAGRGFAVVADEVRALADRTTTATEEIGQSIVAIQNETTQAVERMKVGAEQVSEGLALVKKAGVSLDEIVDGAQNVANMIDSIAAAAEEQSVASGEVSKNVESVSEVSMLANEQANLAANSAKTLEHKADALKRLVNQFKV
ncbi:methyl-accepting chemotaxis protein [Vibrio sp. SCSIO 43135]|nr:CHASE3 domain-containing protein [Vibrio sp. SCSIO 43135]USD41964.1 methyl-accepting chemotaxis protein [Vibrio sp. SCSIO 43135]